MQLRKRAARDPIRWLDIERKKRSGICRRMTPRRFLLLVSSLVFVVIVISSLLHGLTNKSMPLSDARHIILQTNTSAPSQPPNARDLPGSAEQQRRQLWVDMPKGNCGKVFGNGFSEPFSLCKPSVSCWWNSHTQSSTCLARDLVIDKSLMKVSQGGEPIELVKGREESDEFVKYESGALSGVCSKSMVWPGRLPHHMGDMAKSFVGTPDAESRCTQWIDKPTLMVTRYEYANLYHTLTDWYNAYQTWQMFGTGNEIDVVFLDGHSSGSLDDAWVRVFGTTPTYVAQLPHTVTCYRNALVVPPGYRGALSIETMTPGVLQCRHMPQVRDFVRHFLTSFGVSLAPQKSDRPIVLLVFRRDYLAHPRIGTRKASRKISNEAEFIQHAEKTLHRAIIKAVAFEEMTLLEQINSIRSATVIVGVHGAGTAIFAWAGLTSKTNTDSGLSHILFSQAGTGLIELVPPGYRDRVHFEYFSAFAGAHYRSLPVGPDTGVGHRVNPDLTVGTISSMLETLIPRPQVPQLVPRK